MKYFIGIDLSLTGTGIVVLDEELKIIDKQLISTKPVDVIEKRILFIQSEIFNSLGKIIIDIDNQFNIYIEGLSFSSMGQKMLELAALHYKIRCAFYEMITPSFVYDVVPPTVLKKFITGTGTAKKELMLLKVYKKFGVEFSDNNLCDAYCLARLSHFRQTAKELVEK